MLCGLPFILLPWVPQILGVELNNTYLKSVFHGTNRNMYVYVYI